MLFLLAGCIPAPDVYAPDDAPTTAILSPAPGSLLDAGYVELRGRVADETHAPEHIYVTWQAGGEGADDAGGWTELCAGLAQADGTTLCAAEIGPETTRLRLRATDLAGYVGVATVEVQVVQRRAPVLTALAPGGRSEHSNLPVDVALRVEDADDDPRDVDVLVTIDGVVQPLPRRADADGVVRGALSLGEGVYAIDVLATDPRGLSSALRLGVTVRGPNAAPVVRAEPVVALPGDPLTLRGSAVDDFTAPEQLGLVVAEGEQVLVEAAGDPSGWLRLDLPDLGPGVHALTLAATDERGARAEASALVTVDTPPAVTWDTPVDGAVSAPGAPVRLVAVVADALTPPEAVVVRLVSDVDGPRLTVAPDAEGRVDVVFTLSPGAHALTLSATDAQGLVAEQRRDVVVGAR